MLDPDRRDSRDHCASEAADLGLRLAGEDHQPLEIGLAMLYVGCSMLVDSYLDRLPADVSLQIAGQLSAACAKMCREEIAARLAAGN